MDLSSVDLERAELAWDLKVDFEACGNVFRGGSATGWRAMRGGEGLRERTIQRSQQGKECGGVGAALFGSDPPSWEAGCIRRESGNGCELRGFDCALGPVDFCDCAGSGASTCGVVRWKGAGGRD